MFGRNSHRTHHLSLSKFTRSHYNYDLIASHSVFDPTQPNSTQPILCPLLPAGHQALEAPRSPSTLLRHPITHGTSQRVSIEARARGWGESFTYLEVQHLFIMLVLVVQVREGRTTIGFGACDRQISRSHTSHINNTRSYIQDRTVDTRGNSFGKTLPQIKYQKSTKKTTIWSRDNISTYICIKSSSYSTYIPNQSQYKN